MELLFLECPYNWNQEHYIDCRDHDWLYESYDNAGNQWAISSSNGNSSEPYYVTGSGYIYKYRANYTENSARPVLYLKSNVKIKSGSGTKESPFIIGI